MPASDLIEKIDEPYDRIFGAVGNEGRFDPERSEGMDEYEYKIKAMIEDAREYEQNTRGPKREELMRYYMGLLPDLDQEGRSSIVITDVRDTILGMLPSLLRIFTAQEHVCEFIANYEAQEPKASEATEYIRWLVMDRSEGFMMIHSLLKDLLTKGEGIAWWVTDTTQEYTEMEYNNIEKELVKVLALEEGVEIIECTLEREIPPVPPSDANPYGTPAQHMMHVRIRKNLNLEPKTTVRAIPPDEFRIDRAAASEATASIVGWERVERSSDVIRLGFDADLVAEYRGSNFIAGRWNEERILRNEGLADYTLSREDADSVIVGEYFVRIDGDGDGIDELHYIVTMGESDDIVRDEIVPEIRCKMFHCDPEPHTAFGHSITELTMDVQKIKTNIVRNTLDGVSANIWPRALINETLTNMDDALNQEMGAPIRTKDVINGYKELGQRFDTTLPMAMVSYLDAVLAKRTGQTEASKGLDPKALQSTTLKGVDMVVTGAQERIELVARIVAETGFKGLYRGLLREVARNPAPETTIRVRGKWVPVNPSSWDADMGVQVNPAIGHGSDMDRMLILTQIKATQELIIDKMGADNPLVSPIEYRNTCQDLLGLAGIKNVTRYFKDIDDQKLAAFMEQKQKNQPPNVPLLLAQNEQEKVRASTVKHISDAKFRDKKLRVDTVTKLMEKFISEQSKQVGQGVQLTHDGFMQIVGHAVDLTKHSMKIEADAENEQNSEDGPGNSED